MKPENRAKQMDFKKKPTKQVEDTEKDDRIKEKHQISQQTKETESVAKEVEKISEEINRKVSSPELRALSRSLSNMNLDTFILGVSGGDCAGKKELLNYMFNTCHTEEELIWKTKDTNESVAVLHQNYFFKDESPNKFDTSGTDWKLFKETAMKLASGKQVEVSVFEEKSREHKKFRINPTKMLCIEGSHVFCRNSSVNEMINLRVFIDSDSDVRLSRRIYKDTVERDMSLDKSIERYLSKIKTSYEREIDPIKINCDMMVPHFGTGYRDHKNSRVSGVDSNIRNFTRVLMAHIKEAMKRKDQLTSLETVEEFTL